MEGTSSRPTKAPCAGAAGTGRCALVWSASSGSVWVMTSGSQFRPAPPPALDSLFQNIALAESVLAADQGEWLRLMIEAEWYG